jgi:hypothetical protein
LTGNSGYFASLTAFESLLVRDGRLVKPGHPDESELVMLLEGRRAGESITQMPLSGDPFAIRAERGETSISMQEIRNWISELELPSVSTRPDPSVATVQRIDAGHLELGLAELLGLTLEDFFLPAMSNGIPQIQQRSLDFVAVRSPDRTPSDFGGIESNNRFAMLGGSSAVLSTADDRSVSTTFIQNLVPISQSWCRLAIDKAENTALFTVATPATGTSESATLRQQIRDWHLIFLAEHATDSQIDFVVDQVFAPFEASENARTAWIGVCSHFIRHPLFVFY